MCVCVLKEVWGVWEFGGTERGLSWPCPGSAVVVQSQRGSEARNVRAFGNTARAREQTERCKGIINTKSRCHSKWLFLGGSVCANIDWRVCVCVCISLCIISGEEKGKEGPELILSVYQRLCPSVIEFSPSPIVVVFVSGDWKVWFFFLSGGAIPQRLGSTLQIKIVWCYFVKYALFCVCEIDANVKWPETSNALCRHFKYRFG